MVGLVDLICEHHLEAEPTARGPLGKHCGCLVHFIHRHSTSLCFLHPAVGNHRPRSPNVQRGWACDHQGKRCWLSLSTPSSHPLPLP